MDRISTRFKRSDGAWRIVRTLIALSVVVAFVTLAVAPAPTGEATPATPGVAFFGCTTHTTGVAMPRSLVAPLLPPGFVPAPFQAGPPDATAAVSAIVHDCARAELPGGGVVAPARQAWILARVVPPTQWQEPGLASHAFVLAGLVSAPELASLYSGWGVTDDGVGMIASAWVPEGALGGARVSTAAGDAVAFSSQSAGLTLGSPWGEFRSRFYGVAVSGDVVAADHHEPGVGTISPVHPGSATFAGGGLAGSSAGFSRVLHWEGLAWRFTLVESPPGP